MDKLKTIRNAIRRKYPAVSSDASLHEAMRLMAAHSCSALVVKKGEDLIGIVTISDVMYCLTNEQDCDQTLISSFMTACDLISGKATRNPCAQLDEDENVLAAIKVMYEAGVNHLLVSGEKGETIGMVSSLEIIKALVS